MPRAAALFWTALLLLGLLLRSASAEAHRVDAATLSLTEVRPGRFSVELQTSSAGLQEELRRSTRFPRACRFEGASLECGPAGLAGKIAFPWLEGGSTRLMLDIRWLDGRRVLRIATASVPGVAVYETRRQRGMQFAWPIARDYTHLGVEHIWTGLDHLLFVVVLTLLVSGRRALLATVTAFTLAHSLSLGATVLGLLTLPSPPVEASIALSIVLLCAECLRPSQSLSQRAPWLIAFAFGLLHGLGFAASLQAIGLPEEHVPLALLFFNLGVELGQLAIIALVLGAAGFAKRVAPRRAWPRIAVIYGAGTLAAYWTLERLPAVVGR